MLQSGGAQIELAIYFIDEVKLLEEDEKMKEEDEDLGQRLDGWAKRYKYNVQLERDQVVAKKRDETLKAE